MKEERQFPVGIQHFPRIREKNYLYVDKTELIYRMIKENVGVFLSRPRRFGKSLLVSTLESLFQGDRDLFNGLWISHSHYDWKNYHVIKLDFSRLISSTTESLESSLQDLLLTVASKLGLEKVRGEYSSITLIHLVEKLAESAKVVILIDEYDNPLVHHFDQPDLLSKNRDLLRKFFMAIKSLGEHIEFSFITGVSKFTKVSLFSGMNNLEDISLNPKYSALVGLTEGEILGELKTQLKIVANKRKEEPKKTLETMRSWYNGYQFCKDMNADRVYNPLSAMQFMREGELDNFWFSTATPTCAIDLIKKRNFPVIRFENGIVAGEEIEVSHEIDRIDLPTLLFQTGYLTIKNYDQTSQFYQLGFPNEEVRRSFLNHLLQGISEIEPSEVNHLIFTLSKALKEENLNDFVECFNQLFADAPYQIHIKKEAYYHSLIYLVLRALGFKVNAEICTSKGRIDMILKTDSKLFIFEFKIDSHAKSGMEQILEREYHKPFANDRLETVLVSMNFNSESRGIDGFDLLKVDGI